MKRSEVQGKLDQAKGIVRELWGEITGDEADFSAGLRRRLVGKLEDEYGLSREEAEQRVDELTGKG